MFASRALLSCFLTVVAEEVFLKALSIQPSFPAGEEKKAFDGVRLDNFSKELSLLVTVLDHSPPPLPRTVSFTIFASSPLSLASVTQIHLTHLPHALVAARACW
eukprot:764747-Hanusia_phi.AAC.2